MKKITLLFVFIGMITLQSCTVNEVQDNVDNDTISEVFEYTNVDLTSGNGYSALLTFPYATYTSDMVLVYRLVDYGSAGDVWKLLPETYYFDDGTLDLRYDFDFTRFDAELHLEGFDLAGVSNNYKLNQIFRVVIVPGFFGKNNKVNFNDYKAVVKALKIDESKIIKVQQ